MAAEIGKRTGLRYVYAGNLPGRVGNHENTYWPSCQALLIERVGSTILNTILKHGTCPTCHTPIPGVWQLDNPHYRILDSCPQRRHNPARCSPLARLTFRLWLASHAPHRIL